MKTNAKAKKTTATKAKPTVKTSAKITAKSTKPVAKKTAKTTVKAVAKPAAKVTAKKVATKPTTKVVAKSSAKAAVKAPAKVTASKKVAAKAAPKVVTKKASPKVVEAKKSVAKPVPAVKKSVKVAEKPQKTVKTSVKTAVVTPKVAVKSAKPAVKAVAKAEKSVSTAPVATAAPIVVKMPENQNTPARPAQVVVNKISSVSPSTSSTAARPVYRPIQVINKPLTPVQPARQMAPVAKADEKVEFKKGDYVVYPAHGVGEIEAVESATIGGMEIKLYAIAFEKDRMRLKVPVFKAHASGLRRLSTTNRMEDALKTLQGRAQVRRAMWSRRAQEYETKINSGDPVAIAEVLRDLKRSNDETEQSYSERQIYQSALERLAREVAAVEKITEVEAAERLENMIRSKRARAAAAAEDGDIKEAANA